MTQRGNGARYYNLPSGNNVTTKNLPRRLIVINSMFNALSGLVVSA